jgi:FKBP-type peptidyl-prolyl cis-trans isomerase FklB
MKLKPSSACLALSLMAAATAAAAAQEAAPPFKTPLEATSYAVGADMVRNFNSQSVAFDLDQLVRGMKDAAAGGKLLLPDAEIKRLVSDLETQVRQKMIAARKAEGEANQKKGAEFLKAHATKPGVVTLPSGVQYLVVKAGTGPKPGDASTVLVHYKAMLPDGTLFDSSAANTPASLKVADVIAGWREALKLMPAGSKWQLAIPAQLAYGERGAGRAVGPQQALLFEVELVEVR